MQIYLKKSPFTHFLRKWSESIRTILLFYLEDLKPSLFLSIFIFIAEKLRKMRKVVIVFAIYLWKF